MTRPEFDMCIEVASGLWPRWTLTGERIEIFWSMFQGYTSEGVQAAMRRCFHEDPDAIKPALKVVRNFVQGGERHRTLDTTFGNEVRELSEFHRKSGWPVPSDGTIAGYVRRRELMPIQLHNLARQQAILRSALDKAPVTMPNAELYQSMELAESH